MVRAGGGGGGFRMGRREHHLLCVFQRQPAAPLPRPTTHTAARAKTCASALQCKAPVSLPTLAGQALAKQEATGRQAKGKAGSTLRSSRAVPHPSTNRALRRLTSEVGRDPVHSTRYGRQRYLWSLKSSEQCIWKVGATSGSEKARAGGGEGLRMGRREHHVRYEVNAVMLTGLAF
jgi:hypothetical protein